MAQLRFDIRVIVIVASLTLSNLAICTHRSSRVYLLQQSLCLNYYENEDPSKLTDGANVPESLCRIPTVQSQLSIREGIDAFLMLLPALLVLAVYKELLPVVGTRLLLQVNIVCSALSVGFSVYVYHLHRAWSPNVLLLSAIFDLVGGSDIVRITLSMSCIAAISRPDQLTTLYNYISAAYFLASMAGSAIGSWLLTHHLYILNAISILVFATAYGVTTLIPAALGRVENSQIVHSPGLHNRPDAGCIQLPDASDGTKSYQMLSILSILGDSWRISLHNILHLFAVPQPTMTVLLLFLLWGFANRVDFLLPQYISLSLGWPLATVNSAMAIKALVSAAVLLLLPELRSRYLEPRLTTREIDLLIAKSSLTSSVVGMLGLGLGLPAPLYLCALVVYTSNVGFLDSLTAFGTLTLSQGQKPVDLYVRTGLIPNLSGMLAAPFWSWVFRAAVKSQYLPLGLPFSLCVIIYGVGVVVVMRLGKWVNFSDLPDA